MTTETVAQNIGVVDRPKVSGLGAPVNGTPELYGVIVNGPDLRGKIFEHVFYAITKNGGALVAIWYALTHQTGWAEWSGFAVFYALHILGMSLGYHRYFMHKAFETSTVMRYVLGALAQSSSFGSLLLWVADHRRHHAVSDHAGDVHSPYFDGLGRPLSKWKGIKHAHLGWVFDPTSTDLNIYGKGFVDEPVIMFYHRTRLYWYFASAVIFPSLWGWAFGGPNAIIGTILIAGFLRLVLGLHAIAAVNSFGHYFGSERFKERHKAKNNALIALISLGEGWHNNHHAYPNAATTSVAWYEFDPTGLLIRGMEKLGLVWNVKYIPASARKPRGNG